MSSENCTFWQVVYIITANTQPLQNLRILVCPSSIQPPKRALEIRLPAYIYASVMADERFIVFVGVVEQKQIDAISIGADARLKWAQDHINYGFTGK